jgi:tetratricopeptide (TPR) repeat protein
LGRFEEAISTYKKALHRTPDNLWLHLGLVYAYSSVGREKEARASASEVLRIDPQFSVDKLEQTTRAIEKASKKPLMEGFYDNLRKAGLK